MGHKRNLAAMTIGLRLIFVGCDAGDVDTDATRDTIEEAGEKPARRLRKRSPSWAPTQSAGRRDPGQPGPAG